MLENKNKIRHGQILIAVIFNLVVVEVVVVVIVRETCERVRERVI